MFSKKHFTYLCCYLSAIVVAIKQLREPDIWWQLLSGRWMLQNHKITHTDPFSYTMQGKPWTNVKWLYEIGIAQLEKIAGPFGLVLLQIIVNLALVWLLLATLKLLQQKIKLPIPLFAQAMAIVLFLAVVEYRMAGRPEMFSHLFTALFIYLLLRAPSFSLQQIFWLIPLQCLWANMHEGYPVGLVIIAAFIIATCINGVINQNKAYFKQVLGLSLVWVLAVLAILINPNGIVLWKQPFEIYRQVFANKYTNELFNIFNPEYWTLQARIHVIMLLLVFIFWLRQCFIAFKKKNQYAPYLSLYVILLVLFGYLSLTANRNIPFAQIIIFPSTPLLLGDVWSFLQSKFAKLTSSFNKLSFIATLLLLALFYTAIVSNKYYKLTKSPNLYGIHLSYFHNPFGVAQLIKERQIGGTPFSDYFNSSYLLWSLYPNFKSYIDLRDLDVFPTGFFDSYFDLYQHKEKFKLLDSTYHFNYIVLSTSQLVALQQDLYWLPGFNMIYVDPVCALYLKQNDQNRYLNANIDLQKPFTWPQLPEEPTWTNAISKLFNPFYANPHEDERFEPIYEALFNKQMRNYPEAINALKPKLINFENEALPFLTLAQVYKEYADVTLNEELKQKRMDSANYYIQAAQQFK